jgi:SAM-dependent methyltransferase
MLATPTQTEPGPNFDAIKQKQQAAWGSGDYSQVGITLQITGESLCEAMDMRAGSSVLDVAAGNGNATLAAARRFTNVVSTDYVQSLLDRSMARANAEGLTNIDYQIADAESLPFDTASFDNVISTFGVMFAPNTDCGRHCVSEIHKFNAAFRQDDFFLRFHFVDETALRRARELLTSVGLI